MERIRINTGLPYHSTIVASRIMLVFVDAVLNLTIIVDIYHTNISASYHVFTLQSYTFSPTHQNFSEKNKGGGLK